MIPKELLAFAAEAYEGFDESHDLSHGLRVFENMIRIVQKDYPQITPGDLEDLMYITILHDSQDYKYVGTGVGVSEFEYRIFFLSSLGEERGLKCIHVTENMSWSKERKGSNVKLPEGEDWMRRVAQDADWLEAIGEIGLQRCIEYTTTHSKGDSFSEIQESVCIHIREKLLKIPEHLYTATAKLMAGPLLEPLYVYLKENERVDMDKITYEILTKYHIDIYSKEKIPEATMSQIKEEYAKYYWGVPNNPSFNRKIEWSFEWVHYKKSLQGDRYTNGFSLPNPYTTAQVEAFEKELSRQSGQTIRLPSELRAHLLQISREIFIGAYPVIFQLKVDTDDSPWKPAVINEDFICESSYDEEHGEEAFSKLVNCMFEVGNDGCAFGYYMTTDGKIFWSNFSDICTLSSHPKKIR